MQLFSHEAGMPGRRYEMPESGAAYVANYRKPRLVKFVTALVSCLMVPSSTNISALHNVAVIDDSSAVGMSVVTPTSGDLDNPVFFTDDVQSNNGSYSNADPYSSDKSSELGDEQMVVFNNPFGTDAEKSAIVDTVAEGIDNAPPGSTIRIAVFSLTLANIADKLIAAKERGVNVYVLTDDHLYRDVNAATSTVQMERLKTELGTEVTTGDDGSHSSYIKICEDACVGSNIMHAKLFMFSETGDSKLVTMFSSSNMTEGQKNAWNNLYATKGDEKIYNQMVWYFDNLAREPNSGEMGSTIRSGDNMVLTFPTKYSSLEDDPHYRELSKVECVDSSAGDPNDSVTKIDVAMFQWSSTRVEVAKKLSDLATFGCEVRVIISGHEIHKEPLDVLLKNTRIRVFDMDQGFVDGKPSIFSHNKYLIIGGGGDDAKVITGSHNLSKNAIKSNEELTVIISDPKVYKKYAENFDDMVRHGLLVTRAQAAKILNNK